MKKTTSTFALALTGMLLAGMNASAVPIASTTYGGHTYDLWEASTIPWADAQANAVSEGGYLAVLTDSAETTAVYDALHGNGFFSGGGQGVQAWLGGYTADLSGSTTDSTNWKWVTGETWTAFDAAHFASGEPNGDSEGLAINRFGTSEFNDEGGFVGGYIVEKNSVPDSGSAIALLGLSLSGLAALRRKLA